EDIQAELHERPGLAEPGEEGREQNRQRQDVMEVPVEVSAKRLHRVSFQPASPAALFLRRRRGLRRVMAARLAISPGARSTGPQRLMIAPPAMHGGAEPVERRGIMDALPIAAVLRQPMRASGSVRAAAPRCPTGMG